MLQARVGDLGTAEAETREVRHALQFLLDSFVHDLGVTKASGKSKRTWRAELPDLASRAP
jgi:hypothetical protein